ncbi:hypothetical protein GP486_004955 [Trichoglossum hirsutum]|uniref:DNA replication complex GINS protein PSF1 n=1 Tax=Trichoglossum hirsutum TaxID=265104 RepID=A0A9P8LA32_9PEZI|nr:hypothetical protein GP486_004955 [Trichoglossum hirsutum]
MAKQRPSSPPYSKPGEHRYSPLHPESDDPASEYPSEGVSVYDIDFGLNHYPQHASPVRVQRSQNSRNMTTQASGPLQEVVGYSERPHDFLQENSTSGHLGEFDDKHQLLSGIGLYQTQDQNLPDLSAGEHQGFQDSPYLGSPPTPSPSVQSQGARRTRSGRPIGTRGARDTTRSPKPKKAPKQAKGDKPKVPKLSAPLSELTNGFDHIPVRDMEEWVNRPIEVRRQEVEKRNGYVTRPMNSFMLYRSAYAERTKLWCLQNNHQVVSSVSGVSWPLEPPSVRNRYNDLAKIERRNHQNAHPGYKFSPSKAQNIKRKLSEDEESEPSDPDDPDEDYGKSLEARTKRRKKGKQSKKYGKEAGYPVNSVFGLGDRHRHRPLDARDCLNKSSYQITNPGKPLPAAVDMTGLYGHYYQATIHPNTSAANVEDVTMRKTEAPGVHRAATSPLIGLPGGQHYDLLSMSFIDSSPPMDTIKVDPSLLEYDSQRTTLAEDHFSEESMASLNSSIMGHIPDAQFASPYAVEDLESESLHDYLGSHPRVDHQHAHGYNSGEQKLLDFGVLNANDNQHEQWHINEGAEELDPGAEYDKWMDDKVQHAKRTQALAHLPPYQTEIVRAVTREVRDLDKDVTAILEPFEGNFDPSAEPATACALLVDHLCMRRNKRCLLAYHRVRVDKLEEMCWKGSDVLENAQQQEGSTANGAESANGPGLVADAGNVSSLSPEEEEYVRQFSDLLAAYKGQWTDIDLTGSLEPPRDLFIDVRVLKDAGEIQTEYGAITLSKNSQFYVRQGDVERLIAQGYLQRLS